MWLHAIKSKYGAVLVTWLNQAKMFIIWCDNEAVSKNGGMNFYFFLFFFTASQQLY